MRRTHILICITAVLLCSCGTSPPARFYVLHPLEDAAVHARAEKVNGPVSVCVGPVMTARYLDRPQLCLRGGDHQVFYTEFHRWAEPLEDGIARVLAENLAVLLGTARVDVFPWKSPVPADAQVRITVFRFDGEPGMYAELKARWSVLAPGRDAPVFDGLTTIIEAVEGHDHVDLVSALSRAIEQLSRTIAKAMQDADGT